MELITRPQFYRDIVEEVEYLARKANAETAERWHAAVDQTIQQLLRHPEIGRQRTDLQPPGIRSWRVNRFPALADFLCRPRKRACPLACALWQMDLQALEFEP